MSKVPTRDLDYLTDWRGNECRVGDLIVYPSMSGRSCEIVEGVVTRIYEAQREWYGFQGIRPENDPWYPRVRVQPTGRGSRSFYRTDHVLEWLDAEGNVVEWEDAVWDPQTNARLHREAPIPLKEVILTVVENVTLLTPEHGTC